MIGGIFDKKSGRILLYFSNLGFQMGIWPFWPLWPLQGLNLGKLKKIRPLLLYNRGYILYKKWPYFFKLSPPSPIFRKEGHSKTQIFGRKAIIRARNV